MINVPGSYPVGTYMRLMSLVCFGSGDRSRGKYMGVTPPPISFRFKHNNNNNNKWLDVFKKSLL